MVTKVIPLDKVMDSNLSISPQFTSKLSLIISYQTPMTDIA